MEAITMTVEPHNTLKQLQKLYRSQANARLARRIQGVYLAKMGLTCHREQEFCCRLEAGPTQKDGVSVLNGPIIRRILQREFGVLYSGQGLYDLLHRLGYSCLCPRPQHEQANRQAQEAFKKSSPKYWTKSPRRTRTRPSRSGSRMKPALASRAR